MYTDKKTPIPIERIAVAIAFSPRLEGVVLNAIFFANIFKADLIFIHVGNKTPSKTDKLDNIIKSNNKDNISIKIHWETGNPVNSILSICKKYKVELLIAGALEKESVVTYYLGSVARKISRRAKCSTLMLTNPTLENPKFNKIVVGFTESQKTKFTIETAIYFAKNLNAKELVLAKETSLFNYARMLTDDRPEEESTNFKLNFLKEESEAIKGLLNQCDTSGLECGIEVLSGKPGYELAQFAKNQNADLLVVNSPDSKLGFIDRVFPHDLEHVLMNLPCSLLIVHSKVN